MGLILNWHKLDLFDLIYTGFDLQDTEKCGYSRWIAEWSTWQKTGVTDRCSCSLSLTSERVNSWGRQNRQLYATVGSWRQENNKAILPDLPLGLPWKKKKRHSFATVNELMAGMIAATHI